MTDCSFILHRKPDANIRGFGMFSPVYAIAFTNQFLRPVDYRHSESSDRDSDSILIINKITDGITLNLIDRHSSRQYDRIPVNSKHPLPLRSKQITCSIHRKITVPSITDLIIIVQHREKSFRTVYNLSIFA
ncbi:hypothetical protein D3C81_1847050 [compost metagenome]